MALPVILCLGTFVNYDIISYNKLDLIIECALMYQSAQKKNYGFVIDSSIIYFVLHFVPFLDMAKII